MISVMYITVAPLSLFVCVSVFLLDHSGVPLQCRDSHGHGYIVTHRDMVSTAAADISRAMSNKGPSAGGPL